MKQTNCFLMILLIKYLKKSCKRGEIMQITEKAKQYITDIMKEHEASNIKIFTAGMG